MLSFTEIITNLTIGLLVGIVAGLYGWRITKERLYKQLDKRVRATKKASIATSSELQFYRKLLVITRDQFDIVPQAHLSVFLDEKTVNKESYWKWARGHLNAKSVDFLICDKQTLRPLFVIELDDSSHQEDERQERDKWLEELLQKAEMPLVRFKEGEWSTPESIYEKIYQANKSLGTS